MSERPLGPWNVAAGAALIGGVLVVVLPEHALTIVQLVIATVAVAAGLHALAVNVPPTGWISPFKWLSPFSPAAGETRVAHRSNELDLIRATLSARRQRIGHGPPMPPATLRLLRPLIAAGLDLDPSDQHGLTSAQGRVSPLTYAVLTAEPLQRTTWFGTLRPSEREVAAAVHQVLDDVQRLHDGVSLPPPPDSSPRRAR